MFLILDSDVPQGSPEGCRGFRETKLPNVGEVLLAALNLHLRTKVRVTTFDTNRSLVNDQRDPQFFSIYLFLFLTLYVFRVYRAHHQERQIVSIQPLVAVGGRVLCRSEVNFRPTHDTATDSYQRLY